MNFIVTNADGDVVFDYGAPKTFESYAAALDRATRASQERLGQTFYLFQCVASTVVQVGPVAVAEIAVPVELTAAALKAP